MSCGCRCAGFICCRCCCCPTRLREPPGPANLSDVYEDESEDARIARQKAKELAAPRRGRALKAIAEDGAGALAENHEEEDLEALEKDFVRVRNVEEEKWDCETVLSLRYVPWTEEDRVQSIHPC